MIVVDHRKDSGYNINTTHYFLKSGTYNLISYRNVDALKMPIIEAYTHGTGMKYNMGIYVSSWPKRVRMNQVAVERPLVFFYHNNLNLKQLQHFGNKCSK